MVVYIPVFFVMVVYKQLYLHCDNNQNNYTMNNKEQCTKVMQILTPDKVKYKVSVIDTLLSLEKDQQYLVKNVILKSNNLRRAASVLKKKGYMFDISERGRVDDVIVTRLK